MVASKRRSKKRSGASSARRPEHHEEEDALNIVQRSILPPSAQRARVAGRLDLMGASQGVLKIEVRPGEVVTALWERDEPIENYRELFNKDVVVEGIAIFRPSGRLLRIDADVIAPASTGQDFFRQMPHAPVAREYQKLAHLKPNERSAYVQLRGCMPAEADGSDEDFDAAVTALR